MLNELNTFITVVEASSLTKAAKILSSTQPTVSHQISRLEDNFQVTLLKRSKKQKNIALTEEGRYLYLKGKEILRSYNNLKLDLLNTSQTISGPLHIGATMTIGEYFLPVFLGKFYAKYPEVKINVTINNTENICKMVHDLQLDIGLVEGASIPSKLVHKPFYTDNLCVVAPPSIKESTKDLQDKVWITREDGSGSRESWERFMAEHNLTAKSTILFNTNFAVKEAVKNGLGYALVSSHIAETARKNKEISLLKNIAKDSRQFSYLLPAGLNSSKAISALIALLKSDFP